MYKIVFIDDEYIILEGLKQIIDWNSYGIEVVGTATNSNDGIELIKQYNPNIVISDIRMSGMDGLDMIDYIISCGFKGFTIILSGYQDFEYAQHAIKSKVFRYLLKPIDIEEIKEAIESILTELNGSRKNPDSEKFSDVIRFIDEHFREDISLKFLSKKYHFDISYFSKILKKNIGMNYIEYITKLRIQEAKRLLKETNYSIEKISEDVGYGNSKYFSTLFKKETGISPNAYKASTEN